MTERSDRRHSDSDLLHGSGVGLKVELHSLVGRPEFNGPLGSVVSFDPRTGRVGVKVAGEEKDRVQASQPDAAGRQPT